MEEGEETIKFKEALEPESEIEEDSSDKEDSVTNEGTESVKGTFFFQFHLRIICFQWRPAIINFCLTERFISQFTQPFGLLNNTANPFPVQITGISLCSNSTL